MTKIVINDLNESREMDREAMRAVTGGRANSSYVPYSPYTSSVKSLQNTPQNPFDWATAGTTDRAR